MWFCHLTSVDEESGGNRFQWIRESKGVFHKGYIKVFPMRFMLKDSSREIGWTRGDENCELDGAIRNQVTEIKAEEMNNN